MRKHVQFLFVGLMATTMQAGCRDNSPEVARVAVPAPGYETHSRDYEPRKPLPAPEPEPVGPAPFVDEPLMIDLPPEAKPFVDVYRQVGKPRIVVFVNREIDGQIANDTDADHVPTRTIDFEMMELLLSDWMSADNQVTIVSPRTARRKLTEQQARDLEQGKPDAQTELAKALDVDVLIHVHAKPTKQTFDAPQVRVVAESINLKGGESLARAVVDVTPPLDKVQTNKYTRFLARKLMDGMINSWAPGPAKAPEKPAAGK